MPIFLQQNLTDSVNHMCFIRFITPVGSCYQETDKLNEEDLFKFLLDLKRTSSGLKKLKCIPASIKLDISPCPEEHKYCLSPELNRIEPYPDEKGRPTKEIVEFPSRELYVPFTTYR